MVAAAGRGCAEVESTTPVWRMKKSGAGSWSGTDVGKVRQVTGAELWPEGLERVVLEVEQEVREEVEEAVAKGKEPAAGLEWEPERLGEETGAEADAGIGWGPEPVRHERCGGRPNLKRRP